MKYKKYKKGFLHSYALGSFTVLNLINAKAQSVLAVYAHEKLSTSSLEMIENACLKSGISLFKNANKEVERVRNKDREFVFAVFEKYEGKINPRKNHIVLDKPSDMGNLGSIFRTALGFGYSEIALIGNSADLFNPKTIRSSMGAIFDLNIELFGSYKEYEKSLSGIDREIYTFILDGATELRKIKRNDELPISLIFGNESTGLDDFYKDVGKTVYIEHSDKIDSLNLGIAASIAMYNFSS